MLTSRLPHAIAITAATMAPQPGLLLLTSAADQLGLLPLNLPAYGQVSLSFQMGIDKAMACGDRASAQARLQQASKLQPSALTVSYEMDEVQVCGANIAPQDSTHSRQSAHGGAGGDRVTMGRSATLAALAEAASAAARAASHGLRLPSAESLTALRHRGNRGNNAQSQEPPEPTVQSCSFTHQCALELSSLDAELPGAVVLVQLLGPFSAVAGQPISFYWRLERAGLPTDAEQSAGDKEPAPVEGPSKMQFEIFAEGDAWRPLGRRTGTVVLDAEDGSLATVEATLVPLVGGTVPVPLLRLQDVAYQEVFDVGTSGTNYVVVTPQ